VRVAAAVTAALAVAAATAGAASAAPSKPQFIRAGDALCAEVARQLVPIRRRAEAAQSLPSAQKWRAVTSLWNDQVAIQERFARRFRAIGTPRGDAVARNLVSSLDRGLVLARRVRDGFARRDTDALERALPAYIDFTRALNRRVRSYGFRVCGSS
jgi:hypothetical protein